MSSALSFRRIMKMRNGPVPFPVILHININCISVFCVFDFPRSKTSFTLEGGVYQHFSVPEPALNLDQIDH